MIRSAHRCEPSRKPLRGARVLRGICLVVKGHDHRLTRRHAVSITPAAAIKFPNRPDPEVLSEAIPLFFIGRNENRPWVAREAEGRTGGIFLFERSALRFARRNSAPDGCATMFVREPLELDVKNQGNPLIGWLDRTMRMAAGFIPKYPPTIVIGRKKSK